MSLWVNMHKALWMSWNHGSVLAPFVLGSCQEPESVKKEEKRGAGDCCWVKKKKKEHQVFIRCIKERKKRRTPLKGDETSGAAHPAPSSFFSFRRARRFGADAAITIRQPFREPPGRRRKRKWATAAAEEVGGERIRAPVRPPLRGGGGTVRNKSDRWLPPKRKVFVCTSYKSSLLPKFSVPANFLWPQNRIITDL